MWCVAIIVGCISTAVAAQPAFTPAELATHPYLLAHGDRTTSERIERHAALAAIAEKSGDLITAARHLSNQCQLIGMLKGDPSMTAAPCVRAQALAEQHDIVDVKVQQHLGRGMVQAWSFNFGGAKASFDAALKLGEGLDPDKIDNWPIVAVHFFMGGTALELGQFDVAARELTYTREHCRAAGNAECAAGADMWLCRLQTLSGDLETARTSCDAAAVEASVHNDVVTRANLRWMRGFLEYTLGRPQQALKDLAVAWQASQVEGAQIVQPIVAQLMVDSLFALGRLDEADQWQAGLDQGLKAGKVPFFFGPQIAMRRGRLALARLKLDEAEAAFMISSRSLIQEMSIRGLIAAARINRIRGDYAKARGLLEQAIKKIENARATLGGSTLRAGYLTFHAVAYREMAGVHFAAGGDSAGPAVLEVAEAGRARALETFRREGGERLLGG